MLNTLLAAMLCCQPLLDQAALARQQGHKIEAVSRYRQAIAQLSQQGESTGAAEQAVDEIFASMGYTSAARAWLRQQADFQLRPQDYVDPGWIDSSHFARNWPAAPARPSELIPVSNMPVMLSWQTGLGLAVRNQGRCYLWQGSQWQPQSSCPEDQIKHLGKLLQIETASYGLPGDSFRDDRDTLVIDQQQRIELTSSLGGAAFNSFVGLGPKGEVFLTYGMSRDLLHWQRYPQEIQILHSLAPAGSNWLLGSIKGLWQADAQWHRLTLLGFENTVIDKILPIKGSDDYLVWTQQAELYRGKGKSWKRWMPAEELSWVHSYDGQIYCGKGHEFYRWQGQKWEHQTLPFEINGLAGNLWASTYQGPRFSADQGRSWQLSTRGLQTEVWNILPDSQGKLWAETDTGWHQLQGQQWQPALWESSSAWRRELSGPWPAADGSWLWIAQNNQAWLNQQGRFEPVALPRLNTQGLWPPILGLYPDLWLTSNQGLFRYQAGSWQPAGLNDQLINGLYQLNADLWLATGHQGLFVSRDQGQSWQPKGLQGREAGPLAVLGQRWVVALEGNLFVTDNQGQNWQPAQWRPQPVKKFWPAGQGLWAQTPEDLRYSADGGLHWRVALRHPIADLRQANGEAWVVLPLEKGQKLALLHSRDQGQSWQHQLFELPLGAGNSRFLAGPELQLATPSGLLKISD